MALAIGGSVFAVVPANAATGFQEEFAIWRNGQFHYQDNGITDTTPALRTWGQAGDQAVTGDFNGDGTDEFAIWRNGQFHYQDNGITDTTPALRTWGQTGDQAVTGDFNGDGTDEFAIWRNGQFHYQDNGITDTSPTILLWGQSGDRVVTGDFDGNGKDEVAAWRDGLFVYQDGGITDTSPIVKEWGQAGDRAVTGDFNGDGTDEFAIWRSGQFHYQDNGITDTTPALRTWGQTGDQPVVGNFNRGQTPVYWPSTAKAKAACENGENPSQKANLLLAPTIQSVRVGTPGDALDHAVRPGAVIKVTATGKISYGGVFNWRGTWGPDGNGQSAPMDSTFPFPGGPDAALVGTYYHTGEDLKIGSQTTCLVVPGPASGIAGLQLAQNDNEVWDNGDEGYRITVSSWPIQG